MIFKHFILPLIPVEKNKVINCLEDFYEKLCLENVANHMMVSKLESAVFRKKIKENL